MYLPALRRSFVLLLTACVGAACSTSAQRFDLIVRGGQVIDGTGQPPRRADVGVVGDRITQIGDLSSAPPAASSTRRAWWCRRASSTCRGSRARRCSPTATARVTCARASPARSSAKAARRRSGCQGTDDSDALKPFGLTFDWTGFTGYFERLRQRGTRSISARSCRRRRCAATSSAWTTARRRRRSWRAWKRWSIRRCATARSDCRAR